MKFLVIGLGSMGKRRIRCLQALGYQDIIGYDFREDRRLEAREKYKIPTLDKLSLMNFKDTDAIIISTPPNRHNEYIEMAIKEHKPAFVEHSVVLGNLEILNKQAKDSGVLIAPSCTVKFHPAIILIKDIVMSGQYGRAINFSCHVGQYLPDWHPWESIKDFYVGQKETGGCRETIPYDLTWISYLMGFPRDLVGFYGRTIDMGVNIDDTYVISLAFDNAYGNLTVDVTSRYALCNLILNMERGQIQWQWDTDVVRVYNAVSKQWANYHYSKSQAIEGYNKNTAEDMYIKELRSFVDAIGKKADYPNSLDDDIKVLKMLYKLEGLQ